MKKEDFKLSIQSNSWMQIGKLANNKDLVFKNIFQHLNVENLRQAYAAIDGSKAAGIDRITKDQYGKDLDNNLQVLVDRLHSGTYRPQAKRGVEIPKANGKTRFIAVGSFEDKLVEWVLAQILTQIYEPLFIETSYGFRPRRSAFHAIKTTFCALVKKKRNYVVDVGLLEKDQGTPQGGIASPILANTYLHYVIDVWFLENFTVQGGVISRYADDVVFSFIEKIEAERFFAAVKERLAFYWGTDRGHYNYFGLDRNRPKLNHFYYAVSGLLYKWLNRRSQRKSINGAKFKRTLLRNPLPFPPDVRKLKHLTDRGVYVY